MAKSYTVSENKRRQIEESMRRTRNLSARRQPHPSVDAHYLPTVHWFKITGAYNTSTGYPWIRALVSDAGTLTTPDSDDTGRYLFDLNGNHGLLSGQYVRVTPTVTDSQGNQVWLIMPAIPHAEFPVNVTKTSGSAGSATAACSYVYAVKTIDDAYTLGTGMSPVWGRAGYGKKTIAQHGRGYFDASGTFVLNQVDEEPFGGAC